MESVVFFMSVAAIVYVLFWSIQNDGAKSQKEHRGFLKMKVPTEE